MISIDTRKEKIRSLKSTIVTNQEKIKELLTNIDLNKELQLPQEEQEKIRSERKEVLALTKAEIQAATEELNITRLNKNSSSFFQWLPHKGMNRKQARQFYRLRRQGKVK